MTRPRFAASLVFALLAGAGQHVRAEDWTSFGAAPGLGRLSPERSGAGFTAGWRHTLVAPGREVTISPVYRKLLASPAIADGYVVFGSYGDLVRVIRAADGKPRWDAVVPGPIHASAATWRGWLFVPSTDLNLYALRLSDGSLAWKRPLPGVGIASPTIADGSLFVATGDPAPRVLRIDAATGATIWEGGAGLLEQAALAAVAVAGDQVLVAENGGRLHSFARLDGAWRWSAATGGVVNMSSPLVLGQRVYLLPGGDQLGVHALDLATGTPVAGWPIDLEGPEVAAAGRHLGREYVVSSLAGADGLIVFACRSDDRSDTNGNRSPDRFVSREQVVGLDPATGKVLWTVPNGDLDATDPNRVPMHAFTPTPALYRSLGGQLLVAVTSSLEAKVRVLDALTGSERWVGALAGPTRSSPVFANGRLFVATDAGTLHTFESSNNLPPIAPVFGFAPAGGAEVDAAAVILTWGTAVDPEMGAVEYEVRLDDDGEILHDWDLAVTTMAGQLSLARRLAPGRVYNYAVRARDPQGAYSDWSRLETFLTVGSPEITVDGVSVANLTEAISRARPGSTIALGPGVVALTSTLELPAGVMLAGTGPHLTILRATHLDVAVKPGTGSGLRQLTVARAHIAVQVAGVREVHLQNLILRDNDDAGLDVALDGSADLVNATVARNGTGIRASGAIDVRNSLVVRNGVGFAAGPHAQVKSRYNNVHGNHTADRQGMAPAITDLAEAVSFEAGDASDDFRLWAAQATTDRGDPGDDFGNEPAPNGGRINLGAFGNTAFAELSPLGDPPSDASEARPAPPDNGCGCRLGETPAPTSGVLPWIGALGILVLRALRGRRRE